MTVRTSKETGEQDILMIPVRGCPAIHPTLDDPGGHRNFASFEDAKGILKANEVSAVNQERMA